MDGATGSVPTRLLANSGGGIGVADVREGVGGVGVGVDPASHELAGIGAHVRVGVGRDELDGLREHVVRRWPGMSDLEALLPMLVPDLCSTVVIPGCGHWTGEERPDEVNAALRKYLRPDAWVVSSAGDYEKKAQAAP